MWRDACSLNEWYMGYLLALRCYIRAVKTCRGARGATKGPKGSQLIFKRVLSELMLHVE